MTKKETTGDRLKQLMKERNLKQIDIVNLSQPFCKQYGIKIGRNDISQYISGRSEPGQNKLFILGKALNVNAAWLMGLDVDDTTQLQPDKPTDTPDEDIVIYHYNNKVIKRKLTKEQMEYLHRFISSISNDGCKE